MQPTWQPLLEGDSADRAWQAIRAIARDIGPPQESSGPSPGGWSLAGGAAGIALFYAYLARTTGDESHSDIACEYLQASLDGAMAQPHLTGLWSGLLGVSWTFDHLAGRLFDLDEEDVEESDSDEVLTTLLHNQSTFANYDLIDGLVGFGVACLEGLPRVGARRGLDLVLDHLLRSYQRLDGDIAWWTPPALLPEWQRDLAPDGYYNLGVAHGMPAIATFLARCIQAQVRPGDLLPVLDDLVRWMLTQRGEHGFPSWVPKGQVTHRQARLAWCYGDPGVAAALLAAGQATDRQSWQAIAEEIAQQAAVRDPEQAGIKDAGICHGSAGLAHLFHRLYQGTGNQALAAAARHWFQHALDMRRDDDGVGGFQSWSIPRTPGSSGELQWVDEIGLLTGAAGVGICLLAAVSEVEPEWDRALSVSA